MKKAIWRQAAFVAVFLCGVSDMAHAKERPSVQKPQGEPLSQERLNWLVERDRPRDLSVGSSMDAKAHKRYESEVKRQLSLVQKAAAEYRKTRSVKAWKAMLDAVNRGGGLRENELIGGGGLRLAFQTLHEMGPPVDDPENGGNAEFALRRHHAMMRLLARHFWTWDWNTQAERRTMAGYMQDCERRPSSLRPTGNHHDPNCGFLFEMDYKLQRVGDSFWEDKNVPQEWADFAANISSSRPEPMARVFLDYPLVLSRPQSTPYELWSGNERGLIAQYNQPYVANRAYQEARHIEFEKRQDAELDRLAQRSEEQRKERIALEKALGARWDELWAIQYLQMDLQAELENIADSLNRLDLYRSRFQVISYDRIARYCQFGYANECYRKMAMDDAARAQQMAAVGAGGGGGSGGSQTVTVRTYDRNGNYTGSSTTTRIDALLSGARPN